MDRDDLIYDWNYEESGALPWARAVELDDETLRDGLQSPSVTDPPIGDKIRLLHLMDGLGIDTADVGLPGAGPRAVDDVTQLCQEIVESRLKIRPNCAARTVLADVVPCVEISQRTGIPVEVCSFIGSSPIRFFSEGWDLERMLSKAEEAVKFVVGEGLPVMFVTEDTTRADPETLKVLYGKRHRVGRTENLLGGYGRPRHAGRSPGPGPVRSRRDRRPVGGRREDRLARP